MIMAVDESVLVPVASDDTINSIVAKIRGTGARNIQLLVPDGAVALQSLGGFERLLTTLEDDHIDLLVISSDQNTLDAARLSKIETVGVQGARVTTSAPSNGGSAPVRLPALDEGNAETTDPYATQTLSTGPID